MTLAERTNGPPSSVPLANAGDNEKKVKKNRHYSLSAKDFLNARNLYKLSTKEGAKQYHIHRYLGTFVLLHYIYRIAYRFSSGWKDPYDGEEGSGIVLVTTLLHMALSGTSLFFHIPNKRNRASPMIWPEFRWHSILFAYRSFVAMLIVWGCDRFGVSHQHMGIKALRLILVWTTLYVADFVTNHYKKVALLLKDDSTM